MWKKWIRRVFIFCQLTLAIYFSATAIRSWNEYPIVTSGKLTCHWFFQTLIFLTVVGLRSIMEVPFPAVSICYQIDSWKWPGIIKAMIKADETNIIEQLYLNDTFLFRSMKDQLQMGILGFKKSQKYERLKVKRYQVKRCQVKRYQGRDGGKNKSASNWFLSTPEIGRFFTPHDFNFNTDGLLLQNY